MMQLEESGIKHSHYLLGEQFYFDNANYVTE